MFCLLIVTKNKKLLCLDAKVNFDDNSLFRHPEILKLRDLNEEKPTEVKKKVRVPVKSLERHTRFVEMRQH